MIKEILCTTAIEYEHQPDGGKTPVIDAYDGCQLYCPYCFQWRDPTWNQDILVKTNLPEILERELANWDTSQTLYVGSRSDPYMPLESKYRLTRRTLQVVQQLGFPCVLSTKSNAPALLEDIDLFRSFGDKLVVCVGQANLPHLRGAPIAHDLPNIRTANELHRLGIPTWVFITPVLPGITDVKAMIAALPADMPVYLDKLRLEKDSTAGQRFFAYLDKDFPELAARYHLMVQEGGDPYYMELRQMYQDEPRVKFVFGEN